MIHKKAYPRRLPDEFSIEQTRDFESVRSILQAVALDQSGVDWPSSCYLIAYQGNNPVGTVGIESRVDAAMMRSLAVVESMRRRGFGAALVKAARLAAHTRGARTLYTLCPSGHQEWFIRLGFTAIGLAELTRALSGTFLIDHLRTHHPDRLNRMNPLALDIANDGVIER